MFNKKIGLGLIIISDTDKHQLASAGDAYTVLRIQNRAHDNQDNAANGNSVLIGSREQLVYELASGDEVKLYDTAPMNIWLQQVPSLPIRV